MKKLLSIVIILISLSVIFVGFTDKVHADAKEKHTDIFVDEDPLLGEFWHCVGIGNSCSIQIAQPIG